MPKELAFEKTFGHRAAIQFDQRPFALTTSLMDGPRQAERGMQQQVHESEEFLGGLVGVTTLVPFREK
jgi:hypothetical protein